MPVGRGLCFSPSRTHSLVASIPQSKNPKTGSQEEAVPPVLIQPPKTHNPLLRWGWWKLSWPRSHSKGGNTELFSQRGTAKCLRTCFKNHHPAHFFLLFLMILLYLKLFLPGESPWTEKPGGLQSMRLQRVGHDRVTKRGRAILNNNKYLKRKTHSCVTSLSCYCHLTRLVFRGRSFSFCLFVYCFPSVLSAVARPQSCPLRDMWTDSRPQDFPGRNTGLGCRALLQRIFLTQGLNPCLLCLLHCRQTLYHWATGDFLSFALYCVTMGQFINFSGLQFPHLWDKENHNPNLPELVEASTEIVYVMP